MREERPPGGGWGEPEGRSGKGREGAPDPCADPGQHWALGAHQESDLRADRPAHAVGFT